ncbi:MAG: capsule biosynthesis protein [Granulosicoccus sp.]
MQKSASLRSVDNVAASSTIAVGKTLSVSENALLLQGPIGPFFSRFARDLSTRGFNVTKVNFNGGDRFFYRGSNAIDYTGSFDDFEAWIDRVLVNREISRIYLFGDCRAYHRIASAVAKRLNVKVFVFEEGYLRPNFITLEEGGVNGYSEMLSAKFNDTMLSGELPKEFQHPGHIFQLTAIYSMLYYMSSALNRSRFPGYRHHRPFSCLAEGGRWIRSGIRKLKYARKERHVLSDLLSQYDGNYFLCPLQVHCDMQVIEHSDYNSIEHFIGDVLASFKAHAKSNKAIVFKHHPMDRGYTDYSTLFANLVAELGLQGRVYYVHDACLPTLLKHAQGTVLINSTVGISSLFHGTPVKTMGKAVYDIKGLTAQESLDDFWGCDRMVDGEFFKSFRSHLINRNQLNGNLYRRVSTEGETGIVWSEHLEAQHTWHGTQVEATTTRPVRVIRGQSKNDSDYGGNNISKAA